MAMQLLEEVLDDGVLVYLEQGRLKARGDTGALTQQVKERIAANKPALIELLERIQPTDLTEQRLSEHEAYWAARLSDAPALHGLPLDHPRGARMPGVDREHAVELGIDLTGALVAAAGEVPQGLFTWLQAALVAVMARWSGERDIVIGTRLTAGVSAQSLEEQRAFPDNVVALRHDLSGDLNFEQLLEHCRDVSRQAQLHGIVPFGWVVRQRSPSEPGNASPVFQVSLHLDSSTDASSCRAVASPRWAASDLEIAAVVTGGGLRIRWKYAGSLFEAATIERLAQSFEAVIRAALSDSGVRIRQIALMSEHDRQRIARWNATAADYPQDLCVHQLFETVAASTPQAPAVVCGAESLSYGELNRKANRIAHLLIRRGLRRGELVALSVERSADWIAGALAVLKAGGAYVPLDPAYPEERLRYMLTDCAARNLLTHTSVREKVSGVEHTVALDDTASYADCPTSNPDVPLSPEDLAYVIYTSGSTGEPKAVLLQHGATINLFANQARLFAMQPRSRVLAFASISFDAATWEWIMALLSGACLYICKEAERRSAVELSDYLLTHRITHALIPPAMLPYVELERDYALECVMIAGEACDPATAWRWAGRYPLFNAYGPSETTVCASVDRVIPGEPITIGRALGNLRLYVTDEQRELLPIGCPGELLVAGVGVARGYLGREELTREKFIRKSFAGRQTERLYCTGDRVRYLADGRLEFLGRLDDQVKIRGHRVEIGEIEAHLCGHVEVKEAVVLATGDDHHKRLAACVIAADGQPDPGQLQGRLEASLRAMLPDYMVPSAWLFVERFPLTANGKIDRRGLVDALESRERNDAYVAPTDPVQARLCEIWASLLRAPRVGIEDRFFAIGGDSILAIQVVARANQAGIPITTRQLYELQTIAALARNLSVTNAPGPRSQERTVEGELQLWPIQREFLSRDDEDPHHFTQSLLLDAPAGFTPSMLRSIVQALYRRHDGLRARFRNSGTGGWRAEHAPWSESLVEDSCAVEALPADASSWDEHIRSYCEACQRSLNLSEGPLFRAVYFEAGSAAPGRRPGRLFLLMHHLIVDAVSWRIVLSDIQLAYEQCSAGRPIELPARSASCQQWGERLAQYAHSPELAAQKPYWLGQFAQHLSPLPLERHTPHAPSHASTRYLTLTLGPEQTRLLLRSCSQAYRTRIDELLLAAVFIGVKEWSGAQGLRVMLEGHGREDLFEDLQLTQTVGWFTTTHPVTLQCAGASTSEIIRCVKETCRSVPHHGIGYGLLRHVREDEELLAALSRAGEPELLFNYLGQFDPPLASADTSSAAETFQLLDKDTGPHVSARRARQYPLALNSVVSSGVLSLTLDYSAEQLGQRSAQRLLDAIKRGLSEVIAHCVSAEPLWTPSDFPLADVSTAQLDEWQRRYAIERLYPVTPLQQGLLFHSLMDQGAYVTQIALTFDGPLRAELFKQAWQAVVDRYDVFRTAFVGHEERAHQLVVSAAALRWHEADWRHIPAAQHDEELTSYRLKERREGFDLTEPPLMRVSLFRLAGKRYRVLWSHHHMLLDGWSLPLVYREVMDQYEALVSETARPAQVCAPYEGYVRWLRAKDPQQARSFWRQYLGDVEAPTALSIDRLQGGDAADGPPRHRYAEIQLSQEETRRLQDLARRSHSTFYSVLQYAWAYLLHRYSAETTVVFGSVLSGRPAELPDVERTVGPFINTVPVKVVFDGSRELDAALRDLHGALQSCAEQGYLSLADIRRQSAVPAGTSLFDSVLVLENYPLDTAVGAESRAGLELTALQAYEETDYKLTLNANLSDRLAIRCSYRSDVFRDSVVERLLGHLHAILRQLPAQSRCVDIDILTAGERRCLEQWQAVEQLPSGGCIHERFERQAARVPTAIALICGDDVLTYAELNDRANRLAHALAERGVGPDRLVGLCVDRGFDMLVGILGILKAGGAYVPFDPATPQARLRYMLEDSGIAVVVTERALMGALPESAAETVVLDDPGLLSYPSGNLHADAVGVRPDNLAYVIYTSGSTGKPKGVLVEHRHVDRLFAAADRHFAFNAQDVWTLFHSYAFDFSVWEMWGALWYGGRLVLVPKQVAQATDSFYQLVVGQGVTVLNQTPSAFEQFSKVDEKAGSALKLRYVVFGGAALDYYTLLPWMRRHEREPRMINMYGITETTVHVTFREIGLNDVSARRGSMIGKPLCDLSAVVLDPQLRHVPIGVAGELHVGGAGVARGYLNKPELTSARFIPDPYEPGNVLYRTGDIVRRHEDGELEYVGRIDNQVKIRGFRIEPGEIESELNRLPDVRESLVLPHGEGGNKRLVAYVVLAEPAAREASARQSAESIKSQLRRTLPEYMVPAIVMPIAAFPLNINGKIDRAALPPPDSSVVAGDYVEPADEAQRCMARIWEEVLQLGRVGTTDNFFAVGGDSIRAIPLVARLNQAGFKLSIRDLFESPTIAQLSQRSAPPAADGAPVQLERFSLVDPKALEALGYTSTDGTLEDAYPMTCLQQGMIFHNLLSADRATYHDVMSFHVTAPWDRERFIGALRLVTNRHEILRTRFDLGGEAPLQLVLARHEPALQVTDIRHLERQAQDEIIAEAVLAERSLELDVLRPMWRVLVHLRDAGSFQYTLSFHHALLDGWSVANLNTQLFGSYLSPDGADTPDVKPHLPYRHYVHLEMQAMKDASIRRYWREKLEDAELPWWAGKPKRQTLTRMEPIDALASGRLVELARHLGVHERSVLLTAHVALMALLGGTSTVVTSVVSNGRPELQGADATLGLFLNSLPLRIAVGDESWQELICKVDREVIGHYAARRLPLSEIQAECGLDFSASLFNYVDFHVYRNLDGKLEVLSTQGAEEKNYAISLSCSKSMDAGGARFVISIDADRSVFHEAFFDRIVGYLRAIIELMGRDSAAVVRLDRLLSETERATQLSVWNRTDAPYADSSLVHELFEAQVERTPHALAARCKDDAISYRELNERANRIAHALIERGVRPGHMVGVCIESSIHMLAGLLGVLKAGAAYVPLDPAYPAERIRQVVEDSDIRIVLGSSRPEAAGTLQPSSPKGTMTWLGLDRPALFDGCSTANPSRRVQDIATRRAYVIYTSGSTGRPKGVVVTHRALMIYLSHALGTYYAEHLTGSLVATSFAFDLTKPALYLPLLSGGTVNLLDPGDTLTDLARRAASGAFGPCLVRATPMHMQAMLDLMPADVSSDAAHVFVIGGEAFPVALARRLQNRFPRARIYNHYGPSECVIGCAMFDVSTNLSELGDTIPIGRPMSNTSVYVLNERLEPCPLGVPGTLYVAGPGLSDGYLNKPGLTAQAFVPDPFHAGAGRTMYRTGDLVRFAQDGNLLFLGRADEQVKLRGFRIEPGEIAASIRRHASVKDVAVLANGSGENKVLVAYLVLSAADQAAGEIVVDEIKASLRGSLPEYMVPSAFVLLDAFPRSANGKLLRSKLPDPQRPAAPQYVAPETAMEAKVAAIWSEILKIEQVSATASFFDLGGHSLSATRVVSAVAAQLDVDLPLIDMFQHPRLRDLARLIEQQQVKNRNRAALQAAAHLTEMDW